LKVLNDAIVKSGNELVEAIGKKKVAKEILKYFRETRPQYFYSSEIMDKGFKKYRGYPGDFEMMNFVYDNQMCSQELLGKYFDLYFLNNAYAEAVRGRKNKMVELLSETIDDFDRERIKLLNLPCGPARDVREFIGRPGLRKDLEIDIVCVDQDSEALSFAKGTMPLVPRNVRLDFKVGDIIKYVRHPELHASELGRFDFVYSIGLADYLPDKLLQNLIRFCWSLLNRNGKITFAFKIEERDPFAPLPPKWFCDWEFVSRSLNEAKELMINSGIEGYELTGEEWEKSGRIVFITAKKIQ